MITLDIEVTINEQGPAAYIEDNSLVYWCAYDSHSGRWYSDSSLGSLVEFVGNVDQPILCHNAKFEAQWLLRGGLPIHELKFYDTMLLEWIRAGNRMWPMNLGAMSEKYLRVKKDPVVDKWMKDRICPSEQPTGWLRERCKLDVAMTYALWKKLGHTVPAPLLRMRCAMVQPLAEMEMNGLKLNRQGVKIEYARVQQELREIQDRVQSVSQGMNMASPAERRELLYERLNFKVPRDPATGQKMVTATGVPSTSARAIQLLSAKTKRQREFKALVMKEAKLRASFTKFLQPFRDICEEGEAIIHGSLIQGRTRTHRLASSNPNLQNFDRNLRHLFVPQLDELCKNDYSQLEYRACGILANCDTVRDRVASNTDVHSITASQIYGGSFDDLASDSPDRKRLRTAAKAFTFKPLYGGSTGTEGQQRYFEQFLKDHPAIRKWHLELRANLNRNRQWTSPLGLTFYWDKFTIKSRAERQCLNYPVQNFAGEIASLGCIYVYTLLKKSGLTSRLVNYVHDELLIDQVTSEREKVAKIVQKGMVEEPTALLEKLGVDMSIPLDVESTIKEHW